MHVIRPQDLNRDRRGRPRRVALAMLLVGVVSLLLIFFGPSSPIRVGLLAATAAIGIGVGAGWLLRALQPDHQLRRAEALIELLSATLGDDYTLILHPQLPVRDLERLDGILVGPGGVRILTVREWHGRYRVRARSWDYDTHTRHGWIKCRTNPSTDATALMFGVSRWAEAMALPEINLRPAIVFPFSHSQIVLEEPSDEIITTDNAPWWANAYGRVMRVNEATAARVIQTVLEAAEPSSGLGFTSLADRGP